MPAPKNPNTAAATEAAAEAAWRRRDDKAAEWLRSRGWTVTPQTAIETALQAGTRAESEAWEAANVLRRRLEAMGRQRSELLEAIEDAQDDRGAGSPEHTAAVAAFEATKPQRDELERDFRQAEAVAYAAKDAREKVEIAWSIPLGDKLD